MKISSTLLFACLCAFGFTQQFEGEIVYRQTIELKDSMYLYLDWEENTTEVDSILTLHFLNGDQLTVYTDGVNTYYSLLKAQDTLLYSWSDSISPIEYIKFGNKEFIPNVNPKKRGHSFVSM